MNTIYNAVDLLGRIFLIVLYFVAGIGKIGAYAGTAAYMASHGLPGFLLPLVILLEIGGSVLVLVGWHTRIVAFLMAGFTVLAILLFHLHPADQAGQIVQLAELADAGGFLILVAHGARAWSLDAWFARKRGAQAAAA